MKGHPTFDICGYLVKQVSLRFLKWGLFFYLFQLFHSRYSGRMEKDFRPLQKSFSLTLPNVIFLFFPWWHPQICSWHMPPSIFSQLNPPHWFFVQYSNAYFLGWLLPCIFFCCHPALPSVFSAFKWLLGGTKILSTLMTSLYITGIKPHIRSNLLEKDWNLADLKSFFFALRGLWQAVGVVKSEWIGHCHLWSSLSEYSIFQLKPGVKPPFKPFMQFWYNYSFAHSVKSMSTQWDNKVTLVKKLNVQIN